MISLDTDIQLKPLLSLRSILKVVISNIPCFPLVNVKLAVDLFQNNNKLDSSKEIMKSIAAKDTNCLPYLRFLDAMHILSIVIKESTNKYYLFIRLPSIFNECNYDS